MSSCADPGKSSSSDRQHRQGFSVSSILSFLSGTEIQTTPIRTINNGVSDMDDSPPRVLLPQANYPSASSFAFSRLCDDSSAHELEQSIGHATGDIRQTFSETISRLMREQHGLVARMNAADLQVKQVLQNTNSRIKKTEKEAEVLAGSERLSVLAEKSYEEVEKILKLFREVDELLPPSERIVHHKHHYKKLSPLITRVTQRPSPATRSTSSTAPSPTLLSLHSIQESVPAPEPVIAPVLAVVSPSVDTAQIVASPVVEQPDAVPPQPLRLAPRKSRSNLRVPQIRTVPPLPSTQLSTALPTVERDNVSTRSSVASRRSVFSTLSMFLGGQSSRRAVHDSAYVPLGHGNAEERLRKISGSSLLGQTRKSSNSRNTNTRS